MKKFLITASAAAFLIGTGFAMADGSSGQGAATSTSPAVQAQTNGPDGKPLMKSDTKMKTETSGAAATGSQNNLPKTPGAKLPDELKK